MNSGDIAFVLVSAALVMLMTPGLALFYGGMVRSKNVLGTIMQSFIIIGVVTLEWVLFGLQHGLWAGHRAGSSEGLSGSGLSGVGLAPTRCTPQPFPTRCS